MLYVREDILSKQIKLKFTENETFEGFFVEINLRKKSGFFYALLNKILSYLHAFSKALDDLSKNMIIPSYWVISTLNQNEKTCQTS